MSEPRWRDADPRPPYRGVPGSYPRPPERDRGARRGTNSRQSPHGPTRPRWGALPGRLGVNVVIGGAALGAVVTVLSGSEPGFVLGAFLITATIAAALAVRPRAVYRLIPVPALAYVAAAALAGLIHDRATDTSRTAIAIGATQWIASGFLVMTAATLLAIAMTTARWPKRRRGPRGPSYLLPTARTGSPRRPPAARSPSVPRSLERGADYPASTAIRRRSGGRGA
jgi:hypothetical protein